MSEGVAVTAKRTTDLLDRACAAVTEEWRRLADHATSPEEVEWTLSGLRDAIHTAADPDVTALRTPLAGRLLSLLRSAVLSADDAETETDVLELLRAVEAVHRAIEPKWSDQFSTRLEGAGGLDLVVEVAHDFRSPLSSILFLAETLQRGQSGAINDVQRRQLGLVYSAALGLSSLASDMIEIARGGDRLVDKDPAPFSISETLEAVRDIVRPIAEEKGLTVRYLAPESDLRLGHALALSRVLLNLTTNALKFTDDGFVEITARGQDDSVVEFSVRDTGRGIGTGVLDNLYLPFKRATGRDGYRFSGTGLGLAICRKLVEAMGSSLEVETRENWGTRFYFQMRLPAA